MIFSGKVVSSLCAAGLGLVMVVGLLSPDATANPQAVQMVYRGGGLTITVTQMDQATGRFAGQVTLNGQTAPYVAGIMVNQMGQQYAAGQIQTAQGMVPLTIVDESEIIARVSIGNQVYRVKQIQGPAAQNQPQPPKNNQPPVNQPPANQPPANQPPANQPQANDQWPPRDAQQANNEPADARPADNVWPPRNNDQNQTQDQAWPPRTDRPQATRQPADTAWPPRANQNQNQPAQRDPQRQPEPPTDNPWQPAINNPPPADDPGQPAARRQVAHGQPISLPAPQATPDMKTQEVSGPQADMPTHTVDVPQGWQVAGGAWWPPQALFRTLPSRDIKVTSPDGVQVHLGPNIVATDFIPSPQSRQMGARRPKEGTASEGYLVLRMPGSWAQWARFIEQQAIKPNYPGATNIQVYQVSQLPKLTEALRQKIAPMLQNHQQLNQQAQQMGLGMRMFGDGVVLAARIAFDHGGRSWEMLMAFGVTYMGSDSATGRQITWGLENTTAYRAPAGQLERHLPQLFAIALSVRPTQQWAQMAADHARKMRQIDNQGFAERRAIWQQTEAELNKSRNQSWQKQQQMRDQGHQKTIEAIRGE